MNTGLDPSDALKLRKDQTCGDTIWGMRGKTGEEVARHYLRSANLADKNRETMATPKKETARRAKSV